MQDGLSNGIKCPVKDLLYLISQESIEQLRNALLDTLVKSYPEGEFYLYEQGYSLFESTNRKFAPKLIACRSKSENCISKNQLMQLSSDDSAILFDGFKYLPTENYVQVFTVESERTNRGLLITVCKDVVNEHYTNTLISAYNHQVHLLRNKDTDSLTGLLNRQSFDARLAKLHNNFSLENRADDQPCSFTFALLDIDFFKNVNDKYGHVYGDEVLILFSNLMKQAFRDSDMLFRYGGEEFAVLLHDVNLELADSILNRFRETVADFNFPMENKVTTSIGYSEFTNKIPLSSVIERADKALYYAKEHGRNKTAGFEQLLQENKVLDNKVHNDDIEIF